MLKKLLVVISLVLITGCSDYSYASDASDEGSLKETSSGYIHIGFSGMRILNNNYRGVYKFAQLNGSLYPSKECENVSFGDWRKRLYLYLGLNRDVDYIAGIGYYGVIGKFGFQIGDYYNKIADKDYCCYGVYVDASTLRKIWEIGKSLIDTVDEKTKEKTK